MKFPDADSYLVMYSGGKDSLACMDLCVRSGKHIEAAFMYFLPNLDYTEYWCDYGEKTFGVKIHRVPHWATSRRLRRGLFRDARDESIPLISIADTQSFLRQRTGIKWICWGLKMVDGFARRGRLKHAPGGIIEREGVFCPLKDWTDTDVKSYLNMRGIVIPATPNNRSFGYNLQSDRMELIKEHWPRDYERILQVFPYAGGQAEKDADYRSEALARRTAASAAKRVQKDQEKRDKAGRVQPEGDELLRLGATSREPEEVRPGSALGLE